jgi:hypothetical protein
LLLKNCSIRRSCCPPYSVGLLCFIPTILLKFADEYVLENEGEYCVSQYDPINYYDYMNRMARNLYLFAQLYQSFRTAVDKWRLDNKPNDLWERIVNQVGHGEFTEFSGIALVMYEYSTHNSEPWDAIFQRILGMSTGTPTNRPGFCDRWMAWFDDPASSDDTLPL